MSVILTDKQVQWINGNEHGASACAIFGKMTGIYLCEIRNLYPYDLSDFNRCQKLLNDIPEFRKRFDEMKNVSSIWNRLVDDWDKIAKEKDPENVFRLLEKMRKGDT